MVKRRYLPPRRRSERLHKQRCKITRPFEDGGSRQAAADVATCKIVSRSNSNACRCTRESISPHSSLARSISSIHHSPPSLRPSTGGWNKIAASYWTGDQSSSFSRCTHCWRLFTRERERERERNRWYSYNVTLHIARNLPFNLENSGTEIGFHFSKDKRIELIRADWNWIVKGICERVNLKDRVNIHLISKN